MDPAAVFGVARAEWKINRAHVGLTEELQAPKRIVNAESKRA